MDPTARQLIDALGLEPHPEGGYFKETFRARQIYETPDGRGPRNASTCIYFLLPAGTFSAWHVVRGSDEIWHHYIGDPVEIHTIDERGEHAVQRLGGDIPAGDRPQFVVPAGVLQAARPVGDSFALCGCTVAPGFDFEDFSMPARADLLARFPQHAEILERLSR